MVYCHGTIINTETDSIVWCVTRNCYKFHHSWLTKDGQEYLQTGRNPYDKLIVNLETGEEFKSKVDEGFCWDGSWLSSNGNTLAVIGCIWAAPYEYRFYDFTDPNSEWVPLKYSDENILSNGTTCERYGAHEYWIDDDTHGSIFVIHETNDYIEHKNRLIDIEEDLNMYDIIFASGDEHSDNSDYWDIDNKTVTVINRCTKFKRDGDQIQMIEDNHYDVHLTDSLNKNHYYTPSHS